MRGLLRKLLCAVVGASLSLAIHAQEWPAKPVTLLVPFAAGGTVDIVARTIGERLRSDLGQSFIVDNRGGAGGIIATAMLARATPDGHTLLFHHMGLVFNAALRRNLPYDTEKDVIPVALTGATPNVLVLNKGVPIRTVQEFLAAAREKPGSINYGSGGVGSAGHLSMELLQSLTHVQLVHVPYKGSGPAISDLLSGQIQAMLLTIPAVMPYISSGSLLAIATSGRKRSPALPNLPTLAESGVEGFDYAPWYGVFAPRGTNPAVLEKIYRSIDRVIADPDISGQLARQGLEVQRMSRSEFVGQVHADMIKWTDIIHRLGIEAQ